MNKGAPHRIVSSASTITDGTQDIVPKNTNNGTPSHNGAGRALVQCLLIAAQRGQQIYLAREQAARLQQSSSEPAHEETSQTDES
ncbi:hypothetical protein TFLX_05314 [Thermoflexales bacterium]|nr:hypothetical protein TFLX_05314 [Thermoflexales bacterium]